MNTLKLPHMLACVFVLSENCHCILFISKKLTFQGHGIRILTYLSWTVYTLTSWLKSNYNIFNTILPDSVSFTSMVQVLRFVN